MTPALTPVSRRLGGRRGKGGGGGGGGGVGLFASGAHTRCPISLSITTSNQKCAI